MEENQQQPEEQPVEQANRFRDVTWPEGSEDWLSPDFDPSDAPGWAQGQQANPKYRGR